MEKRDFVKLISEHWKCTDKNVYGLMNKPAFEPKMKVIKLGCLCVEHKINFEELSLIIEFIENSRKLDGK